MHAVLGCAPQVGHPPEIDTGRWLAALQIYQIAFAELYGQKSREFGQIAERTTKAALVHQADADKPADLIWVSTSDRE
jgi:hypothetical protein